VNKDEQDLQREDQIFVEIASEEESETSLDAALLNDDEGNDEFVQDSVDAGDLSTGFNFTIPTREVGIDEDTQGDESEDVGGDGSMTEFEVSDEARKAMHGDEIELDLDEALATGRTVTNAPESD
jgi:hypothetical protein